MGAKTAGRCNDAIGFDGDCLITDPSSLSTIRPSIDRCSQCRVRSDQAPERSASSRPSRPVLDSTISLCSRQLWRSSGQSWSSFVRFPMERGITGDTVAYISMARNLLERNEYFYYTEYPPLFPLLLALIGIFDYDPLESAGPLNAVVFGLTVFVSVLYLRRRIQSRFLLFWASVAIVASWPLATVCFWAQTEASFIFFTVLSLCSFDRFLDTGNRPSLVRAAIFTALACLDRYAGVSIVGSLALLLWWRRGMAVRERIGDSLVYTIIAMFPLSLFVLANFLLRGTPIRIWSPSANSFQENVASIFATFGTWIVGPVSFHELAGWFTATFGRELTDGTLGVVLVTVTVLSLSGILSRVHFLDVYRKRQPPHANSVAVFVGFTIS